MLSSKRKSTRLKKTARIVAVVGVATGLFGVLAGQLPWIRTFEDTAGLGALYAMRGYLTPPASVIVVGLSSQSGRALGISEALENDKELKGWPRSLQAELIDVLRSAGAQTIVFDLFFGSEQTESNDSRFAGAIRDFGSVILFDSVDRDVDALEADTPDPPVTILGHTRKFPIPLLRDAALTTAPFVLPTRPLRTNQYWTFPPMAADAPSLPVAAFAANEEDAQDLIVEHLIAHRPELASRLRLRDLSAQMTVLRRALRRDSEMAATLTAEVANAGIRESTRRAAASLLDLYSGEDNRFLRLYGPPRTVTTVPVEDLLLAEPDSSIPWQGATVFVGNSEPTQPDQADYFLSIYSQPNGTEVSGVEFAASAYANLVDGTPLSALSPLARLALLLGAGLYLGVCFGLKSLRASLGAVVLGTSAYVLVARYEFNAVNVWIPFAVPVFMQAPFALLAGLWSRYHGAEQSRVAVSRGVSRYLPSELIEQIAAEPDTPMRRSELVNGVCMITDIENYTAYAERLSPKELEVALNAYYESLFEVVIENRGLVTDMVGDSMVAVWREPTSLGLRDAPAVKSALEISARLSASISAFPRTRVGITAGEFILGTIGAESHLEYRAVGDTINSAARVQALNKRLGTTVLVERAALASRQVCYRELGTFELAGKRRPLEICEPLSVAAEPEARWIGLVEQFHRALELFRRGEWRAAAHGFERILREHGDDGPSWFYVEYIRSRVHDVAQTALDHVIRLGA